MSKTTVVNCKTEKYDVYIGRGSMWGNPFTVGAYGRKGAIQKYKQWLETQPQLIKKISQLKGKILGCYCKPLSCHGDVLADIADGIVQLGKF